MNKTIVYFLMTVFIVSFGAIEAKALGPTDTVLSYFQALKHGDIDIIEDLISVEMYNKRKIFFEQNQNYAEILKKAYQTAQIQIIETAIKENDAQINVEVNYVDKTANFIIFLYIKAYKVVSIAFYFYR